MFSRIRDIFLLAVFVLPAPVFCAYLVSANNPANLTVALFMVIGSAFCGVVFSGLCTFFIPLVFKYPEGLKMLPIPSWILLKVGQVALATAIVVSCLDTDIATKASIITGALTLPACLVVYAFMAAVSNDPQEEDTSSSA